MSDKFEDDLIERMSEQILKLDKEKSSLVSLNAKLRKELEKSKANNTLGKRELDKLRVVIKRLKTVFEYYAESENAERAMQALAFIRTMTR